MLSCILNGVVALKNLPHCDDQQHGHRRGYRENKDIQLLSRLPAHLIDITFRLKKSDKKFQPPCPGLQFEITLFDSIDNQFSLRPV